jgi:hypothetical protein
MEVGELLTRWTVRVALAFYVAGLASRCFSPRWSRPAWTAGCVCYLLHVACAFEYYHHWSHADAYEFTARQTAAVVGLDWGGGLYANYAFTLLWLADVVWWWLRHASYLSRPRWIDVVVHGYLGFIAFNATVVFAQGWSRWFGIAACVVLMVTWIVHVSPLSLRERG